MPFIFVLHDFIKKIVTEIISEVDTTKIVLEPTKDPSHGDLATNAAMVCAKNAGMQPKVLAIEIQKKLLAHESVKSAVIAGPGFINITLNEKILQNELLKILAKKGNYANQSFGNFKTANVEYVSTNPTGPLHIGHGRNAVLGDCIANLLAKVGFNVTKEYYVNDAGGQTISLAKSAYLRYKQALGHNIADSDFNEDMYKGDYLIPVGVALKEKFHDKFLNKPESEWLEPIRLFTISCMLEHIKKDLNLLGVNMNVYTSEMQITSEEWIEKSLEKLTQSEDVYQGTLEKPKGHEIDDWQMRPQTLFNSTKYGDDTDRALKKSDNTWTYFAGDVGYHFQKISRGYDKIINVLGFDHIGYVKRLTAAVKALKNDQDYTIKTCQMVNFKDNGQPVRMSKRAGNFITVNNLIEKVGKDSTRFMMVSRHQDMVIDFDFQKAVEQSSENPLFYIQYAHARIYSVLRHAVEVFEKIVSTNNLDCLNDNAELTLMKTLIQWPRIVQSASIHLEPHRISNYLYNLASDFHALWNKGKDNAELRFIEKNNQNQTAARITLIRATAFIIAEGLNLLGIEPKEEMR